MTKNFRSNFYDAKQLLEDVRHELVPLAIDNTEMYSAWEFIFSGLEGLETWEIRGHSYGKYSDDYLKSQIDQCKFALETLDLYALENDDQGVEKLRDKVADAIEKLEAK